MEPSREVTLQEVPILPAGINTRLDPALLDPSQLPDAENVLFDRGGAFSVEGLERVHAFDLPVAGLLVAPTPLPRVARTFNLRTGLPGVIPYDPGLVPSGAWQLDLSFTIRSAWDELLTGADQTEDPATGKVGRVGAPAGGEFQFSPLAMYGGDDVTRMSWAIGLVVARPAGYGGSGSPETGIIRLVFFWWEAGRLRYSAADRHLVAGHRYHLSFQLGAAANDSGWYLAVNDGASAQLSQLPTTDGASALPAASAIDWSVPSALYIGRPPSAGKWPSAPLWLGRKDLVGGTYTPGVSDTIQLASLTVAGITANSWVGYYARCTSGADLGLIRRVSAFNGVDTITLAASFPAANAAPATWATATWDLIPPLEACPMAVSFSELRFWRTRLTLTEINRIVGYRLATDRTSQRGRENSSLPLIPSLEQQLLGYWSLSDDGGEILRDQGPSRVHGWIAGGAPHETGSVALDGIGSAIQLDIEEPKDRPDALGFNLGRDGVRIAVRFSVQLGRDLEDNGAAAIEDCLFESLAVFADPKSTDEPFFALRWAKRAGLRRYYFRVSNGRESSYVEVDPTLLAPDPGRRVKLFAGIQRANSGTGHRVFIFELDGEQEGRGWSAAVAWVEEPLEEASARRWSFGGEVAGIEAQGAGSVNASLSRWWHVAIGLRPGFDKRFVAPAVVTNPALDPWTSIDDPSGPYDMLPPLAHDALTMRATRGSSVLQTTSGAALASSFDSFPAKYLLSIGGAIVIEHDEEEGQERESMVIAVDAATLDTATMERSWDREDASALELRVIAWCWSCSFRTEYPQETEQPHLVSLPPEGEVWACTKRWIDEGALSLSTSKSQGPRKQRWAIAVEPTIPGSPQELYRARWDLGSVKGFEPVRMIAPTGLAPDEFLIGRGGSVHRVTPAWVRLEHGQELGYAVRARSLRESIAKQRETESSDLLRLNRRNDIPGLEEGIEWLDGTAPVRISPTGGPVLYYLFQARVWFDSLDGRRTIASRVGTEQVGNVATELVNFDWHLRDGVPCFSIVGSAGRREIRYGANTVLGRRMAIRPRTWVTLGVQIGIDYGGDAWLAPSWFLDGRRFTSTLVRSSSIAPSQIPLPSVVSFLMQVYGSFSSPTPLRWSLGGQIRGFSLETSGTEFTDQPVVPIAP